MLSRVANYPLLVKIQTIDLLSDLKTTGTFKPRTVTCVDTSKQHIFVGVTSGTVYVFSREDLTFKFIIPFKGGKVCLIACSDNEDVAIGSVRGHVSIYQINQQASNQVSVNKINYGTASVQLFKHLGTIEHHLGNEITELHWGPYGRYLFVGDSQGLVSQANVRSSDKEFPRSTSMSDVILKLKNRIIQIHFLFPYLTICSTVAVYLCDIENEDFVRIQSESKDDIQATGVCLVYSDSFLNHVKIKLYVSEAKTNYIHCFNLQGQLLEFKKIEMNSFLTKYPVSTFDPIIDVTEKFEHKSRRDSSVVSLGKLFVGDDGLILSVSHDHLYLIDPIEMKLILWSDEFHKIHYAKLISNYVFLWSSNINKVYVLSLTQVQPYTEQLFRSGATDPLERWIRYCLFSLGWQNASNMDEDTQFNICKHFSSLVIGERLFIDVRSDELVSAISNHVPFCLELFIQETLNPTVTDPKKLVDPNWKSYKRLIDVLSSSNEKSYEKELEVHKLQEIWTEIQHFYNKINIEKKLLTGKPSTLNKIISSFPELEKEDGDSIYSKFKQYHVDQRSLISFESNILAFLKQVELLITRKKSWQLIEDKLMIRDNVKFNRFTSLVKHSSIDQWLQKFGIPKKQIVWDAFLADCLLLCLPLLDVAKRLKILFSLNEKCGFCTWFITSTFGHHVQFSTALRSLFTNNSSSSFPSLTHMNDIFSSIYREILPHDKPPRMSVTLQHLVTLMVLINLEQNNYDNELSISDFKAVLTNLLSSFPLKHIGKIEIEMKLKLIYDTNQTLLRMFEEACVLQYEDNELCKCGVPINCFENSYSHPAAILTMLNSTKEIVFQYLLEEYLENPVGKTIDSPPVQFAMKCKLFSPLIKNFVDVLPQSVVLETILRISSCSILQYLRLNLSILQELLTRRQFIVTNRSCGLCGANLILPKPFESFSNDCIGIWIYNCTKSIPNLQNTVEQAKEINTIGTFSLEFYKLLIHSTKLGISEIDCRFLAAWNHSATLGN